MIRTIKLKKGITLVLEAIDVVKSVAMGVWIKNGSIDEALTDNGISHFVEHMMFKGSKKRDAKGIAEEMARIGGRINAFTSKEYTCYYAHTLTEHMDIAVDVLADMLCHPAFREEEIEKEKKIILDELAMTEDTPEDKVHDQLEAKIFENTPLAMEIIGTKENIESFTRQQLYTYVKDHYIAKNITIVIVGAFDLETIEATIEKAFQDISTKKSIEKKVVFAHKSAIILKEKEIEQTHMVLNFPTLGYKSDEKYTLSLLNTLIGGGIDSRLFLGIREEKGLTYSIYSYAETYTELGIWNIYATFNPDNFEEILVSILLELDKFLMEGLTEEQLKRTKEQIKSNLIIGYESMNSRMSGYGKTQLMLGYSRTQDELLDGINQVTCQDIMALAKCLFDQEKMSVSIVGNLKNIDVERVTKLCEK